MSEYRSGLGWDVHQIAEGRPMILGGVTIQSDHGLVGHSNADVLAHAITDAILGAACLGDIGMHFPDTDSRWKDADSMKMLAQAAEMAHEAGFELVNVDATVILERPKLQDYRLLIRRSIAECLRLSEDSVSVKFKTSEKVGPVGEGRAAEALATACLKRRGMRQKE